MSNTSALSIVLVYDYSVVKGIVYPPNYFSFTQNTHPFVVLNYFLRWNTKGEIRNNCRSMFSMQS